MHLPSFYIPNPIKFHIKFSKAGFLGISKSHIFTFIFIILIFFISLPKLKAIPIIVITLIMFLLTICGNKISINKYLLFFTIILFGLITFSYLVNLGRFLWYFLDLINCIFPILFFSLIKSLNNPNIPKLFIRLTKISLLINVPLAVFQFLSHYIQGTVNDDVATGMFFHQANMLSYYAMYSIIFFDFAEKYIIIRNVQICKIGLYFLLAIGNGRAAWIMMIFYFGLKFINNIDLKEFRKLLIVVGILTLLLFVLSMQTGKSVSGYVYKLFQTDLVGLYLMTDFGRGAYTKEAIQLAESNTFGIGPGEFGGKIAKLNKNSHIYHWLNNNIFTTIWGQTDVPMDTVANSNITIFIAQYGFIFIGFLFLCYVFLSWHLLKKRKNDLYFFFFTLLQITFIVSIISNIFEAFDIMYLDILIIIALKLKNQDQNSHIVLSNRKI